MLGFGLFGWAGLGDHSSRAEMKQFFDFREDVGSVLVGGGPGLGGGGGFVGRGQGYFECGGCSVEAGVVVGVGVGVVHLASDFKEKEAVYY